MIEQTAAERIAAIAENRDVLIGINKYPNALGKPVEPQSPDYENILRKRRQSMAQLKQAANPRLEEILQKMPNDMETKGEELLKLSIEAAAAGATIGILGKRFWGYSQPKSPAKVKPVRAINLAEPYERIRRAAEKYREETGNPLKARVVFFGEPAPPERLTDFAADVLGLAGFSIAANERITDADMAIAKIIKAGARVVVIPAATELLPGLAGQFVDRLKATDKKIVILSVVEQAPITGSIIQLVDEYIYPGMNIPQTLTRVLRKAGVVI